MAATCPSTIIVLKTAHLLPGTKLSFAQNIFIIRQCSAHVAESPITENWQVVKTCMCQKRLQSHDAEPRGLNAKFF